MTLCPRSLLLRKNKEISIKAANNLIGECSKKLRVDRAVDYATMTTWAVNLGDLSLTLREQSSKKVSKYPIFSNILKIGK